MTGKRGFWQQVRGRRLSRRSVLSGAILGSAGLAAATVVGCAQEEKPTTAPAPAPGAAPTAKQPKRGGTVVRAGGSGGSSLDVQGNPYDPHTGQTNAAKTHRLVYQALLGYDLVTLDPETDLAEKWEQPSPTEYIFTLAPGVKWQNRPPANGRPLRAEDVVFSLERIRTNEARFIHRSLLAAVDEIAAVDNARVRVTARKPSASLLAAFSADPMLILAREVVEKAQKFATPEEVVGTGPFILKSIRVGVDGEYIRNPDYWKAGLPYLDEVRTLNFADGQAAFAAFLAKTVDVVLVPGDQAKKYIAQQGPSYSPLWYKAETFAMFIPNTKAKPMDDPRVTKALHLLMDHQEFITAWAGIQTGRGQHGSILPTALDDWDVSQEEYERHLFWKSPKDEALREALQLLSAAGFTSANPLRFELMVANVPVLRSAGELLEAQWRRLGRGVVQVTQIKLLDQTAATSEAAKGTFAYASMGNAAGLAEPSVTLNQLWRTGGSRNWSKNSEPEVDALIDRQDTIFDVQQRKELVRRIVRLMMDRSPAIPPANRFFLDGINPKIQDFKPEWFPAGRQYQWIWLIT